MPKYGIYVTWGNIAYYRDLCAKIKRTDIELISSSEFSQSRHRFMGRNISGISLDHAIEEYAPDSELDKIMDVYDRILPYVGR